MSVAWRDRGLAKGAERRVISKAGLDAFNRQVMACQDQAYTLAVYLLGDEAAADAAVAQAVRDLYGQGQAVPSVRVQLLRHILRHAGRRREHTLRGLPARLSALPARERHALLLVDLLSLSYDEAAGVLDCPRPQLAERLAAARQHLVEQERARTLAPSPTR